MPEKYWNDFTVGETFKSMAITVTETHVVTWAGLTMDFYPLHMDAEYAAQTPFKQRVVHGPLTFALAVGLMGMTGEAKDAVIAWLGVDNMRIPAPVFIGDTIKLRAEVTELKETKRPAQGFCRMRYQVSNQRDEVVMEFDMNFLMHRRETA
ncbi:MAG: MaoC family dehydratase N-terminal domain-containing protein [Caldilineales bacterium]|nr:MaoC family dehydratase N-terminal domain-containing protein [Caldilineales bacterium]MCW5857471.1 MaoC family dehydratase N-terminal domain-containing protein [Caldilineales bacterium]